MRLKVYLSNISPLWPLGRQEKVLAPLVPGWPDVPTYCDTLSANVRKAHNAGSLLQRASMLRPTARRPGDETVYVASLACLAWGVADFSNVLAAMSDRDTSLVVIDTNTTIPPDAGARVLAAAVKAFVAAKRSVTGGGPIVGALASAAMRRAETNDAIRKIEGRWKLPTKDYPTWQLLTEAQLSRNTVVDRLGKRPDAQRRYQAGLKRAARRQNASMSPASVVED